MLSAFGSDEASLPHELLDGLWNCAWHSRQRGRPIRASNSESFPIRTLIPQTEKTGDRLRKRFELLLAHFAELAKSSAEEMQRQIETVHEGDKKVAGTLEAVLWQMVAHNSYHIGQVAMIRRALDAWPPKAGGDSW